MLRISDGMERLENSLQRLIFAMEAEQNASKAANMAAYLKNRFACYGIKSPIRNEIQKAWFASIKGLDYEHWDVVFNLWNFPQRELHYVAIDFLNKVPKKDIRIDDHKFLEELLTTHSWWDSVDAIASNYVGKYFQKFPEMKDEVISRWRASDNFWLNRTCLIFQLKYKEQTDFELLKELIRQFQPNKEFFIQKAIGWSLRQHGKFFPNEVLSFVQEIHLQGLARREALKHQKDCV